MVVLVLRSGDGGGDGGGDGDGGGGGGGGSKHQPREEKINFSL